MEDKTQKTNIIPNDSFVSIQRNGFLTHKDILINFGEDKNLLDIQSITFIRYVSYSNRLFSISIKTNTMKRNCSQLSILDKEHSLWQNMAVGSAVGAKTFTYDDEINDVNNEDFKKHFKEYCEYLVSLFYDFIEMIYNSELNFIGNLN